MREIKFRAWDKSKKEMVDFPILLSEFLDVKKVTITNKDCELMQYIDLKDKNGKEVYEGDIVVCTCGNKDCIPCQLNEKSEVYWNNDVSAFCFKYQREPICKIMKKEPYQWCCLYGLYDYKIIGNIYENPELLK